MKKCDTSFFCDIILHAKRISYCFAILILSVFCHDTTAQSYSNLLSSFKIVYTKYNAPSDYFDGSDVFLYNSLDTTLCISGFNKKSSNPLISSDGKYISYKYKEDILEIVNMNNSQRNTINLKSGKYIWHPDGKQILYQDYSGIKAYDLESRTTKIVSANDGILPWSISADGNTVLCQQMQTLYQMFLVSYSTKTIKKLDGPGSEKRFGSFSTDNKYVVYSGGNNDLKDHLYSYNLSTQTYKQLTNSDGQDLEAVFSPDGQYICFASTRLRDTRGNYKLYIMKADGNDQKMIYDRFVTNIKWPKNSDYIYFLTADGICRIKSDGSNFEKVINEGIGYFISDFDIVYFENAISQLNDLETFPSKFVLKQNYPNPFNPSTTIDYQLSTSGFVTLKVYDLLGREVATLVDEFKQAGTYNSKFSIINYKLSSGVYFYRLQSSSYSETKKLILMK